MEAVVQLYGGGSVVLAPLLEWETTLTGGVPCDSFYLKCPYHAAQAALLERAWRVTLQEKGAVLLRAVVDETEIVQNGAGGHWRLVAAAWLRCCWTTRRRP